MVPPDILDLEGGDVTRTLPVEFQVEPVLWHQSLLNPRLVLEGQVQEREGQSVPRARVIFSRPANSEVRECVTFT